MRPLRRLLSKLDVTGDVAPNVAPEPVSMDDVQAALASTRSTTQAYSLKYEQWEKEFGSV